MPFDPASDTLTTAGWSDSEVQEYLTAVLRLTVADDARLETAYMVAVEKIDLIATLPAPVRNAAVIRMTGYLYDRPDAPAGASWANAYLNSGAASLVGPHLARGARGI